MSDVAEFDDRFDSNLPAVPRAAAPGQATQIEQVRAIAEVRAMVMLARENPRNEDICRRKMQRVCAMPALAEVAFFRVPRGYQQDDNGRPMQDDKGKKIPNFVNGETIDLARELARCWGNMDYSVREMSRDDAKGQSEMMAYAWDLEENVRPGTVFVVAHKLGKFRITSNQQIYENNASQAGRRLREQIFNALPTWFKAEAIELCHQTLRRGDGKPLAERVKIAVEEFGKVGVDIKMLERKFGRSVGEITPEDLATMRVMLRSIRRGETRVEQEFGLEGDEEVPGEKRTLPADADPFEKAAAGSVGSASADPPIENAPEHEPVSEVAAFCVAVEKMGRQELSRLDTNAEHKAWLKGLTPPDYAEVAEAIAGQAAGAAGWGVSRGDKTFVLALVKTNSVRIA